MFKSILMLDLDSMHSNEIAATLYSKGYRVLRCDSMVKLEGALKGSWDAVLTEWDFYHLSGAGLIQHLMPARQPVIIFSRRETAAIAATALEAGARGVYSCFSRAELTEELERILSEPRRLFKGTANNFSMETT